jgi:hypothetical protein
MVPADIVFIVRDLQRIVRSQKPEAGRKNFGLQSTKNEKR